MEIDEEEFEALPHPSTPVVSFRRGRIIISTTPEDARALVTAVGAAAIGPVADIVDQIDSLVCEHEWVDMTNEVIQSGEMCRKCNMIRPSDDET